MRFIAVLLLGALSLSAQITFKGYAENSQSASSTTIAASSTLNVAAGDAVVACVGRGNFLGGTPTISDGGSNTSFTKVGTTSSSGGGETVGDVDLFILLNASANSSATFTVTYPDKTAFRWVGVANYSGVATSSAIDQSSCSIAGCAQTTSTNVTAVNVTTTQADELLVYCGYNNNIANWTAANSFNLRSGTTGKESQLADKIVSSTGSYPNGNIATLSASVGQVGVFGTFKAAAGGGGGTTLPRRRPIIQ